MLADSGLVVQGRVYEGFPLLIGNDGHAVEPAQAFLWDELAANGRAQSRLTWAKCGRDLYDYFAFLEANRLGWADMPALGMPGHLDRYRDWSKAEVGLQARTINARLRLVARFYEWAQREGLLDRLPFRTRVVRVRHEPGFLGHVQRDAGVRVALRPGLAEPAAAPEFLTMDQVLACIKHLPNETHRLMLELMVRCGLRQVECRTFPMKYLCNPAKRADLRNRKTIRVRLDPGDMTLKYGRARSIDVPTDLMTDLWWYVIRYRRRRLDRNSNGVTETSVFLTERGRRYVDTALTDVFAALEKRVGFYVRPHMLRHTYATYTLWRLRRTDFAGDPLIYVRDRLGHSSVATTSIYLHMVNQLDAELVLQHEDEIDALFHPQEHM
ncbi:tyrosine-type recombinase/integrase [Variovorax sp. LARHSF232]